MKNLIAFLLPGLTILISLPLAFGLIPPNGLYGFRTPKTLASRAVWYPANRVAGWLMIAASALSICVILVVGALHPEYTQRQLSIGTAVLFPPLALLAIGLAFVHSRRLN